MPNIKKTPKERLLQLLRKVILSTLKREEYSIALKAIELLGKEEGLFQVNKHPEPKKISDYSTNELISLLEDIDQKQQIACVRET